MLDDPVLAMLLPLKALILAVSAETACVTLPLADPADITAMCEPRKAAADWHLTDVSDTQLVHSHDETPILPFSENCICVNPLPSEKYTNTSQSFDTFVEEVKTEVRFETFETE
jgi:hypothetical protein